MRIIFIGGSLEPGKDGVGDYTRRLAFELAHLGHSIWLMAVNDPFVEIKSEEKLLDGGITLVRLPRALQWGVREQLVMEAIKQAAPDWVSVQFVPFAFHPKGLCWRWLRIQGKISRRHKLHVMFHEIWVEWDMPIKLSSRLLGVMQRAMMLGLGLRAQIAYATTHLEYYKNALQRLGVECDILPLFGNIPVLEVNRESVRRKLINEGGVSAGQTPYIAGFFGSIVSSFSEEIMQRWLEERLAKHKSLLIVSAGKQDALTKRFWDRIQLMAQSRNVATLSLGPLSEGEVSGYLAALDEGLSGYSAEFLGKSSSAASMINHGIRVTALGFGGGKSSRSFVTVVPEEKLFAYPAIVTSQFSASLISRMGASVGRL